MYNLDAAPYFRVSFPATDNLPNAIHEAEQSDACSQKPKLESVKWPLEVQIFEMSSCANYSSSSSSTDGSRGLVSVPSTEGCTSQTPDVVAVTVSDTCSSDP